MRCGGWLPPTRAPGSVSRGRDRCRTPRTDRLSQETKAILTPGASGAVKSELKAGTEMWDDTKAVRELRASGCSTQRSVIDQELLSLSQYQTYMPPDALSSPSASFQGASILSQQYVVLDGHTIHNLELLQNNDNGHGGLGQCWHHSTVTIFGERLFEVWLWKSLCGVDAIHARLDAEQELILQHALEVERRSILKTMPEHYLSRIHALGVLRPDHPDDRVILYETSQCNVRKIINFVATLSGFQASLQIVKTLKHGRRPC
ncbi:hypothetical protein DYB32_010086 [Aphanomyces invadans]|uniref:DNA mismatch repair protein MutS core domain-containing protein n=1 Tax=Aphanomyces invadans TaxID=157072 RepID=A0A3R6V3A1_9STRA|nr:hypothetical protein DYB32_010086 [Aphanomyces invadans]